MAAPLGAALGEASELEVAPAHIGGRGLQARRIGREDGANGAWGGVCSARRPALARGAVCKDGQSEALQTVRVRLWFLAGRPLAWFAHAFEISLSSDFAQRRDKSPNAG